MNSPGDDLIQLAHMQFSDLTNAEAHFLRAATLGRFAWYGGQTADAGNPPTLEAWSQLPMIRAEVIRWLCMDHGTIRLWSAKTASRLWTASFPPTRIGTDVHLYFRRIPWR
jgi:hypothetical protein